LTTVDPSTRCREAPWRSIALLVGIASLAFYYVIQRAAIPSYDGGIMLDVARNIVFHGSLHTTPGYDYFGINTPYAYYGIGNSLLAAAAVAVHHAETQDYAPLVTLINPVLLAFSAALLVGIGRRLGWRPLVAVVAALSFSGLTMAAHFSTEFFSEPGVTFAVTLVIYAICLSWERQVLGLFIGSLGIALGVLFRSDSLILLLPLALLLLRPSQWKETVRRRPGSLLALTPIPAAVAWVAWYNWYRYGSVTKVGYDKLTIGFNMPLWRGLNLLVVSPGRGFFWFNVILIPGLVGAILVWKKSWRIGAAIAYGCVARLFFYAKWDAVAGGVTWGPRFLLPCCALLTVGLGEALEWTSRARRVVRLSVFSAVATLALLSAVVSQASWWVPYEQYWREVSTPAPGESPEHVAQRIDDYYHSVAHGEILGTIRLMDDARPLAPERLRGGLSMKAFLGLVTAVLSAVLGVALSWGRHASRGPPSSEGLAKWNGTRGGARPSSAEELAEPRVESLPVGATEGSPASGRTGP
jgi:hypothetical protein